MKKYIALILALIMCVGCFAGCGKQQAETAVPAAPANDKQLVLGIDSDIDNLNPMSNQMNNFIALFVFNVYEPLFHLNGDMEYEMDLAESVEQLDELKVDSIPMTLFKSMQGVEDYVLTESDKAIILESVNNALKTPFAMTQSQYTTAP